MGHCRKTIVPSAACSAVSSIGYAIPRLPLPHNTKEQLKGSGNALKLQMSTQWPRYDADIAGDGVPHKTPIRLWNSVIGQQSLVVSIHIKILPTLIQGESVVKGENKAKYHWGRAAMGGGGGETAARGPQAGLMFDKGFQSPYSLPMSLLFMYSQE
ncbi:hypothetical protein ACHAXR_010008, partial [Thalassiosira sp. AJA248-18]